MTIFEAANPSTQASMQRALDMVWAIVDEGEPVKELIAWLHKGRHAVISDLVCEEVVLYLEKGERKV